MKKETLIRINDINIKDYMYMKFEGLPTSVKWREVKDKVMSNDMTFEDNCLLYKQRSYEVLQDEPSKETLKQINKVFYYGNSC